MSKPSEPGDQLPPLVQKALSHEVRRAFLHRLRLSDRPLSPAAFAATDNLPLSRASYHARALEVLGVTECTEKVQRQGSQEALYVLGGPNCEAALQMLDSSRAKKRPPPPKR